MKDNIILFCMLWGAAIAFIAFIIFIIKSKKDSLKTVRKITVEKFEYLNDLNSTLREQLTSYGLKANSFDLVFFQRLTMRQCISILNEVRSELLTKENLEALKHTSLEKRLNEIKAGLDSQIRYHLELRTYFNLYINN